MRSAEKVSITAEEKHYRASKRLFFALMAIGVTLLIGTVCLSLTCGNYHTSLKDVVSAIVNPTDNSQVYRIIALSRVPRLIAALFVGAALSVAGLVYQDIFLNRMASPDLLGVSAGAGCGASFAIIMGFGFSMVGVMSFFGGIIAVTLTIVVSNLFGRTNKSIALILGGIVIAGLMNSLLGLFKYVSSDTQLATITFWLLGGFNNVTYKQLTLVVPIISAGLILLYLLRWKILMLRNGDLDAKMHGINSTALRYVVIVVSTIITALSVCISGTIGWIGLAIPNLMRIFVSNDSKRLMPLTIVYGMVFTATCDLLARTLTKSEIPVGILSGALGACLFVIVLVVRRVQDGKKSY